MNEEMDQIEKNDTWVLVPRPKEKNIIGTKWVFKNKLRGRPRDKEQRNTSCKGYAQIEGIDFEETFALVAGLETIKMFISFSRHNNIIAYKMDMKSTFLNGDLEEEVYIQ